MSELAAKSEVATNRRLISVVGLLLLLQALGILTLAGYLLFNIDWDAEAQALSPSPPAIDAVFFSICFVPVAMALVLIGIAFLLIWRRAWVLAILMQGLLLGGCLYLYFVQPNTTIGRTYYVYFLMLSGIFLLLYLNSADVRLTFQKRLGITTEPEGTDE